METSTTPDVSSIEDLDFDLTCSVRWEGTGDKECGNKADYTVSYVAHRRDHEEQQRLVCKTCMGFMYSWKALSECSECEKAGFYWDVIEI